MDNKLLEQATAKAVRYLISQQHNDGLWYELDACPGAGASTFWVSAYTAYRLSFYVEAESSVRRAIVALLQQYIKNNGWGYNIRTPHDADTMLCVIRLFATASDIEMELKLNVLKSLVDKYYDNQTGGIRTYAPGQVSFPAWTQADVSITALFLDVLHEMNAARVFSEELLEKTISFLLQQEKSGFWPGYWYITDAYATYYTLTALLSWKEHIPSVVFNRVVEWSLSFDITDCDIFSLAYLANILFLLEIHGHGDVKELCHKRGLITAKILKAQGHDGRFSNSRIVWLPDSVYQIYAKDAKEYCEVRGIFSTAACLEFFSEVLRVSKVL